LERVTETYLRFEGGDVIYFLNGDSEVVRVESIEKVDYDGKIYDVDVGNDVVLVRRLGSSELWSGNSDPVDYMGLNNGSAVDGAAQTDAGKFGKGFSFDGDGDYLDVSADSSLNFSQNYTISLWVKAIDDWDDMSSDYAIWDAGMHTASADHYSLLKVDADGSNNLQYITTSDGSKSVYSAKTAWNAEQWYHVVIVHNSSNYILWYIDGSLDDEDSFYALNQANYNGFHFGVRDTTGSGAVYFNGTLDDVMIFNRSLSAEEILGLYANQTSRYLPINYTGLGEGYHTFKGYAQDMAGNVDASLEVRTVLSDLAYPLVDYDSSTPADVSYTNGTSLYVNVSVIESNFANITFTLHNSSGEVNVTTYTSLVQEINWTLGADGNYTYNVTVVDLAAKVNSTATRTLVKDTVAPALVLNTEGMPDNNSVGASSALFNWTVSDNIDGSIACYPTTSVDGDLTGVNVANATTNWSTETLSGGTHLMRVRCEDDAGNSNTTLASITYLVAVINFSAPVNNLTYRIGDEVTLFVEELDGTDFLTNVTIPIVRAGSIFETANSVEVASNNWSVSYTLPSISPTYLTARGQAFNQSVGASQNVTQNVGLILLRAAGNTSVPTMTKMCPNRTYVINATDALIEVVSDLDTLVYSTTLNVTSPSGINYTLSADVSTQDTDSYVNSENYTLVVNETGVWTINSTVEDFENQSISSAYNLTSATSFNTYSINSSTVTNMSVQDRCDGAEIDQNTNMDVVVVDGALLDLNVSIDEPLVNATEMNIFFRELNLTGNVSDAVNFTLRTNETDAPTNERRILTFDLNSSLNFTNYTITYDYSDVAHSVANESALKMWKCANASNCTLVELNSTVNETADTISATATNFSRFMITEPASSNETATETVTVTVSGGGSTVTETVYRSLQLLVPGTVELSLADEVVVPIQVLNPEDVAMSGIALNASPNTEDLSAEWEKNEIESLGAGENETILLYLESHSKPGEYDVDITATVTSPMVQETAKLYVRLVEAIGKETLVERIVLATDMFRENPECLELNDLLEDAELKLEAGDIEGSKDRVQLAIAKCKDLIAGKESPLIYTRYREWLVPVSIASILLAIAFAVVILLRKPKFNFYKNKEKKSSRGWFGFGKKKSKKVGGKKKKGVFS